MLCRCVLYTSETCKVVDLRCHRQTRHRSGLCEHCRKHRAEDRKSGTYKRRWGLARRRRR
jgi:hypothetical protein